MQAGLAISSWTRRERTNHIIGPSKVCFLPIQLNGLTSDPLDNWQLNRRRRKQFEMQSAFRTSSCKRLGDELSVSVPQFRRCVDRAPSAVDGNAIATSRQSYIWHGYLAGSTHSHDLALILNTWDVRRFREYIVSAAVDPTRDVASENINRAG